MGLCWSLSLYSKRLYYHSYTTVLWKTQTAATIKLTGYIKHSMKMSASHAVNYRDRTRKLCLEWNLINSFNMHTLQRHNLLRFINVKSIHPLISCCGQSYIHKKAPLYIKGLLGTYFFNTTSLIVLGLEYLRR